MSRESNQSGDASSLRKEADGLDIAADRPDAAPAPGDDRVRAVASALVLLALIALFAYTAFQAPRHHSTTSGLMEGDRHESR